MDHKFIVPSEVVSGSGMEGLPNAEMSFQNPDVDPRAAFAGGWGRFGLDLLGSNKGRVVAPQDMEKMYANFLQKYGKDNKPGSAFINFADETTTSSPGQLPVTVEPKLIDLVNRETVLLRAIGVRAIDTLSYYWNPATAGPTPYYATEAGTQANVAAPTVAYQLMSPKYLFLQHTFTNVLAAISRVSYQPIQDMMEMAAKAMLYSIEYYALLGDGTSNTNLGLNTLLDAGSARVNAASTTITLAMIEQGRRDARVTGGRPMLGLTDNYTYMTLYQQLKPYLRTGDAIEIKGDPYADGVRYMGMNIYPCHALDGLTTTNRIFLGLDTQALEMLTLQPLTVDDLGIGDAVDGRVYRWRWYGQIRDKSASDASNHDGSGGLHHFKIYGLA